MYDVIVIGGGFAGLAAATQLARARRKVLVLDTGLPRNRYSATSQGFLTRDGAPPSVLLEAARSQLARYGSAELRQAEAIAAAATSTGFAVELASGQFEEASRLILAHGVTDELSGLPGFEDCWGRTVLHCPYCHGFEVADQRLGLLLRLGDVLHLARFYRDWTSDLTILANGAPLDAEVREALTQMQVKLVEDTILRLEHEGGELRAVVTATAEVPLDAIFAHPPLHLSSSIGVDLGCETKDGEIGPFFVVDHQQQTSVEGVFAAGDIARPGHAISFAVGDGAGAGIAAHLSLFE